MNALRESRGIALLFSDLGTRRGWGFRVTPWPLSTPGKDPVAIVQEAGRAPGPVWKAENLAPPGFDSRTVQPIASHYTDWATRPTNTLVKILNSEQFIIWCLKFYTANVNNMGSHIVSTEHVMSIYRIVCLMMVTVIETCSNFTLLNILLCFDWTTS